MIDLKDYNEKILLSDKDDERNEESFEEDLNLDLDKFNQAVIWLLKRRRYRMIKLTSVIILKYSRIILSVDIF